MHSSRLRSAACLALLAASLCGLASCHRKSKATAVPIERATAERTPFDPRERPTFSDPEFIRLDDASVQAEFSPDPPLGNAPAAISETADGFSGWTLSGGSAPDLRDGRPTWRVGKGAEGLISPPLDIPFRDLRTIELRFSANAGRRLRVWCDRAHGFTEQDSIVAEIRPNRGELVAVVTTASLRGHEKLRLSRLRFDPTDGEPADVRVESIRLIGREGSYAGRGHGLAQEVLGNERRNVVFQRAPARLTFTVLLPRSARLDVGAGILDGPTDLRVTVSIETAGRKTEVLHQLLSDTETWHDLRADLSRWGGRRVRLTLAAESSRPGQLILWTNPIVDAAEPMTRPNARPNVLLYLIDTLRADGLGAYGAGRPTSPTLDRLASEGVLFERYSAAAAWTRPSVASLLTSLPPPAHGGTDFGLAISDGVETLVEQMRRAGYVTAGFTLSSHAGASPNLQQGYDFLFEEPAIIAGHARGDRERGKDFDKSAALIHEKLLPWLERQSGRPIFLYVHAMGPHGPYRPRPHYGRLFATGYSGPIDGSYDPRTGFEQARTPEEIAHIRSLYEANIRYTDDQIGDLIEALRARALLDSTLLAVVSDHGEEFREHGGTSHGQSLYRELLRVPLILRLPGVLPAGARVRERVSALDLMPTILDLVEVAPNPDVQGRSLVPLVRADAQGAGGEPPVFAWRQNEPAEEQVSIERGDFHLILLEDGTTRLYDQSVDPDEQRDLSAERPEVARALADEAHAWLASRVRLTHAGQTERLQVDADERRQLEALGYVR